MREERANTVKTAFALSVWKRIHVACFRFRFYACRDQYFLKIMTVATYQELFYYTAFPVFAVLRSTGEVIYKNIACEKYLPKLSKKNSLNSFVFAQRFDGVGPVKLAETTLYHTAIAFEDGENSVFLFLSHLQYQDGMSHAARLFQMVGPSLEKFLSSMRANAAFRTRGSVLQGTNGNLYAETVQTLLYENDFGPQKKLPFYQVISCAFEKLNSVFSEYGYRVNAKIDEDFPKYLHVTTSVQDILFIIGRLLYLMMKVSKTKNIELLLSCDMAYSRHTFRLTTETNFANLHEEPDIFMGWLLEFIPECKIEFSVLQKAGLLSKENFASKMDSLGNLSLFYSVPYTSPESYYVRSIGAMDIFLLGMIDNMIESIRDKLTNTDASC